MKIYSGKSVCGGIAVGTVYVRPEEKKQREVCRVENVQDELLRFENARKEVINRLTALAEEAKESVGGENAEIFEIHAMMLLDEDFAESVTKRIAQQKLKSESAVEEAAHSMAKMLAGSDSEYMRARAADVEDIAKRLTAELSGEKYEIALNEPRIIFARDLTPGETVEMDKSKILAFVTCAGSTNSHTAILARSMNIPAIADTKAEDFEKYHNHFAVVDGYEGKIYLDPTAEIKEKALLRKANDEKQKEELEKFRGKETLTRDGKKIHIYANIGNIADIAAVKENDGEGVGLFRSEFLYMGKDSCPDEEEQFQIYKAALTKMEGKRVIIRTLDIGADKQTPCLKIEAEENPALGVRGIRFCLKNTDIFKTQLRALWRASVYGRLSVMFPMITSLKELDKARQMLAEAKEELIKENVPVGEIECGIMIETPAAALISDELAKKADFFSIGTNDLSQYTLAVDRQNRRAEEFFDPYHKAVLKMMEIVAENAHKNGKWVGVCGELGADEAMTEFFVKIGIDELSVAPARILPVRKAVFGCSAK